MVRGRLMLALCVVGSLFVPAWTMYKLSTECPTVPPTLDAVCPEQCTDDGQCSDVSMCCPNACGSHSCAVVAAPCTEGDTVIPHHGSMEHSHPDLCGFCWCQNGDKACHHYDCLGPIP
ncbi:WAP four-disulfide core domain protein 18 [Aplysia californica]|uniref:WAP four-disulfide core domain protein 18 n=1 Tax=Aplysia californica TaxID=6500 RepID=A0ABM1ADS0_APLCA|nr:WAP four-disulfide core domain protein 18 [Aplysia californica]